VKKVEKIDPDACDIADAARKALEDVLSRNPTVLLIVYETSKQVGYASVPASTSVALGLYIATGNVLMPD
jgi:hypothetical protein